jgi:hypothetical protein
MICVWCRGPVDERSPDHPDICLSCHRFSEEQHAARQKRDAEHVAWVKKIRNHPAYIACATRLRQAEQTGREPPKYLEAAE